jgi:redox-sensitive bicupin YhaK (pirin superfamily)
MNERRLTDGTLALDARRLTLDAGERVEGRAPDAQTLWYVVAGSGSVSDHALAHETVVVLEPREEYVLEAGGDGLEILEASPR